MSFRLFLMVHGIKNLPVDCSKSSMMIIIEWRGSGRKVLGFLHQGMKQKNCTSKQPTQPNGTVTWKEGFNCICNLKRINSQSFKSWIVNLQVQVLDSSFCGESSMIIGETEINIAEYAPPNSQKRIRVPIRCSINDQTAEALLKIKFHFVELRSKASMGFKLPRTVSLRALSCVVLEQNQTAEFSSDGLIYPSLMVDSSSDDEPEVNYEEIASNNLLLGADLLGEVECFQDHDHEKEEYILPSPDRVKRQPSLVRLLSKKTKLSFKTVRPQPKGEPLLNKTRSDVGGDDIDIERHESSFGAVRADQEKCQSRGFEDEGLFEVGVWERRRLMSRDGEMELVTDIFLASIDQRSEKAAGESACTVLAVVIADWLHKNPKTLPLRCQLDELIHQGSLQWRKLCEEENHKEKFLDQHFDLDTVLAAKVRSLIEIKTMSYIGFFGLDNDMPDTLQSLQETMSFDTIWDKLRPASASEERIYITSWNDHFFVLKVERNSIYLIDTLGERLFEGCSQAYIMKFDEGSVMYKRRLEGDSKEVKQEAAQSDESSGEVMCEGMVCCKEYVKRFLAALPLRELQEDVKRGVMEEAILHRCLQIEFHHTAPSIEE
ncbi:hypothetical protein Cni_G04228 [Canna indica]|uniref:C2 NT-type domain-containing protein n=1 Tax=Canna indica TaxID=4628 RepID=A0AAQ3JT79_9LILI|nr:hypothetical protein Cni_G04228 [Canna indica]